MALVRIPALDRTIDQPEEIRAYLAARGIDYERTDRIRVPDGASADELLAAHQQKIDELKAAGGYVTADVIDVHAGTPNLEAMLNKFNTEHWHDEDEVRFIVEGRGLFHVRPAEGPVFAIEVEAGDLIRVPKGTHHWFDLCVDRRIRAIRLFQDPAGWTPHYTGSGADRQFQPLCFAAARPGRPRRARAPGSRTPWGRARRPPRRPAPRAAAG
jgi:1,2-dihydroxy-3-keto-5-methylthiopentene dioxygenase